MVKPDKFMHCLQLPLWWQYASWHVNQEHMFYGNCGLAGCVENIPASMCIVPCASSTFQVFCPSNCFVSHEQISVLFAVLNIRGFTQARHVAMLRRAHTTGSNDRLALFSIACCMMHANERAMWTRQLPWPDVSMVQCFLRNPLVCETCMCTSATDDDEYKHTMSWAG